MDEYIATVTVQSEKESVTTFPLLSRIGQSLIKDAILLGYVEGSSLGHISAREINDSVGVFNTCTRQEFDMNENSPNDGGRVWEHWTTTRNITTNDVGLSVMSAYLSMLSLCGSTFLSVIARGRKDYGHPEQLKALIVHGLISKEEVNIDINPKSIPLDIEKTYLFC